MPEKVIVSLVETTDCGVVLLANRDNSICGFESIGKGLHYYEDSYNRHHAMSYEGSMSALINAITYRPSIVMFDSFEQLIEELFGGNTEGNLVVMNSISGSLRGYKIPNQEAAKTYWEIGDKPKMC